MLTAGALGLVIGLILALTGAGGAILAVPLLMFSFHWDVARAAPVGLMAVASAAAVGSVMGLRAHIVRYRAALLMAGSGSAMAPLGLSLAHRLPAAPLTLVFATVLLLVARRLWQQARLTTLSATTGTPEAVCQLSADTGRLHWTAPCTQALLRAGAMSGLLSGLLGVGGGFVIVPALRRSTDLPMNSIVATSLMVIALISTSAVTMAAVGGHLDLAAGLPFAAGAVIAMLVGRPLAARLAGPRLQQGFAVVSGLVALGLAGHLLLG